MTRHKILLPLLAAALMVSAASASEYSHARVVRLSLVEGDVQVTSGEEANWQKAIVNMPVREGMSIATGQGRAEVEFENGATARIADNSVLRFTELALADGNKVTRLNLSQGTASIYTNREHHDTIEVQGGKLQITARDNSHFRIDVFEDGVSVSVEKGSVEVATTGGSERVNKGQTLAMRNNAPDQIVMERNPSPDSWDHWVADRNDAMSVGRNESMQYLNSPVSYGLSDLSYYGGWYNYGGFGNCWRPFGVSYGWSPFYNGNWSYLPGFGFTWTSFEPWGWMPYHYGRWAFSPTLGWLWVPGYFHAWNPGAVHWYRTPGKVGWVPMSPHDKLGGTPQNLPHGVITNTATGLATGSPHTRGFLAAGESPRFISDPRADQDMVRTGQQIKAAQDGRATLANSRAGSATSATPAAGNLVPERTSKVGDAPRIASDGETRKVVNSPASTTAAGGPATAGATVGTTADHNPASTKEGALVPVAAPGAPARPRRMADREITTAPAHVFTVVPVAPSTSGATPASAPRSGSTRPSASSPAPRPASSTSAPRPAPASHPSPAAHPSSSHPSSSRPPSSHPR